MIFSHPFAHPFAHYRYLCVLGFSALTLAAPAQAQISSDGSLSTTVNSIDGLNFTIEQGDRAGNNLFHSFDQFSVPTNGSAFFNNATDIQTIFSRVTGGNASIVEGLIQANGTANLFLLNPRGLQFGSGAQLQIGGSFYGSTADRVVFADGIEFNATQSSVPLLTVSMPVGLQFGQTPAPIDVTGPGHGLTSTLLSPIVRASNPTQLQVNPGQTLALVGGDMNIIGGILTAPEGRVELGSIGNGAPTVDLVSNSTGFNLTYSTVASFGDITLDQRSLVDVSGSPAGSIQVFGNTVRLLEGSQLLVQNLGNQRAGDIVVNAVESFEAIGASPDNLDFGVSSGLNNETLSAGDTGDIFVTTQRLVLLDGGAIYTRNFSSADGGDIYITASESLDMIGFGQNPLTFTVINTLPFGSGDGGDITITTGDLLIDNGAGLNVGTIGVGNGGNLLVNAESIVINGFQPGSLSDSNIGASNIGPGQGGTITINTGDLTVSNGAQLTADNSGLGAAGSILINATEFVKVEGELPGSERTSNINASTLLVNEELRELFGLPDVPIGDSGTVEINTPVLYALDSGAIRVRNEGVGNAGSLQINAGLIVLADGGNINASSPVGNGGSIDINAGVILANTGGFISADANGDPIEGVSSGTAGEITIDALAVSLDTSTITASGQNGANAGTIDIDTVVLDLDNNSTIAANAENGVAGNVRISALAVLLDNASSITATSLVPANNGVVKINAWRLDLDDNSFIQAGTIDRAVGRITVKDGSFIEEVDTLGSRTSQTVMYDRTVVEASGWQMNTQGQMELVNTN